MNPSWWDSEGMTEKRDTKGDPWGMLWGGCC